MERRKSLYTAWFEAQKAAGNVRKVGTAAFTDGRAYKERALWEVTDTFGNVEEVVMLNGNAYDFKRYPKELQTRVGIIRGRI